MAPRPKRKAQKLNTLWCGVAEAGRLLSCSPSRIYAMIARGELRSEMIANRPVVSRKDAEARAAEQSQVGAA